MKKLFVVFLLLTTISIQHVDAMNEEPVTWQARQSFEKEFPGAQYDKWELSTKSGLYLIRFVYQEHSLLAYMDEAGILHAIIRDIDESKLPWKAREILSSRYFNYKITKTEELTTGYDVSYMVAVVNKNKRIILRVYPAGGLEVIRKEKIE